jgi:hypothetical protein
MLRQRTLQAARHTRQTGNRGRASARFQDNDIGVSAAEYVFANFMQRRDHRFD